MPVNTIAAVCWGAAAQAFTANPSVAAHNAHATAALPASETPSNTVAVVSMAVTAADSTANAMDCLADSILPVRRSSTCSTTSCAKATVLIESMSGLQ
ncbi:hypothetical protein D3C72_1480730 [compost metagenome]